MKTLYETARDSLIVIESIASGSTTTNSLHHLARLAREGLTAIESADRAQQGEPMADDDNETEPGWWFDLHAAAAMLEECGAPASANNVARIANQLLATKAAAPADAPTDLPKRLRIKAGLMAMGERIGWGSDTELMLEAADYIERATPVPDTGIPTVGEVPQTFDEAACRATCSICFDEVGGEWPCARKKVRGRAPASTTPTSGEVEKAAPRTDMTDEQASKWAWEQVKDQVGTKGWTAGESGTYYGFFLWGWRYREQYESQRAGEDA